MDQAMNFWIKRLIIVITLLGLITAALFNLDFLMSLDEKFFGDKTEVNQVENNIADGTNTTVDGNQATDKPTNGNTPQKNKKDKEAYSKNAAAAGLSRFYASINPEEDDGPKIINGLVFLPKPKGSLEKYMEARRMVTRPLPKKWKGSKKSFAFREGQTLYQKLTEFAKKDKLEVIWRLNHDLLVKAPFRINKSLFQMAYKIGQAMSGHYPGGVSTYFCYKHRAIVLIEYTNKYLDEQCILLKGRSY